MAESRENLQAVIELQHCDITSLKVDVCVSSIHRSRELKKGPLASYMLKHCGPELQEELDRANGGQELEHGQVVESPPFKHAHKCNMLLFVCLLAWNDQFRNDETLIEAVYECLERASAKGYKSIAFPTLGMGGQSYPPFNVAMAMMFGVVNFKKDNPASSLVEIYFVLHKQEMDHKRTFLQTCIAKLTPFSPAEAEQYSLKGAEKFGGLENTTGGSKNSPRRHSGLVAGIVDFFRHAFGPGSPILGILRSANILGYSENLNFGVTAFGGRVKANVGPVFNGNEVGVQVKIAVCIPQCLAKILPKT